MSAATSLRSPSSLTSTHSGADTMSENRKYILNRDTVAKLHRSSHITSSSKSRLLSSRKSEQRVLQGSLWAEYEDNNSTTTALNSTSKPKSSMILPSSKDSANAVFKIYAESLEVDDLVLQCAPGFLSEINDDECRLLLAIPNCDERFKVFSDRQRMNSGRFINVGSDVVVSRRNMLHCRAAVKWKGRLAGKQGVWFGVEITDEDHRGIGDTDGSINNIKLFECSKNNGMFVNVGHITLVPPKRPLRRARSRAPSTPSQGSDRHKNDASNDLLSQTESELSFTDNDATSGADLTSADTMMLVDLQVHDRVVWPSERGYEAATVRWIGTLPDNTLLGEILVGVEFDSPIGKGTGVYKNQRLFEAKKGHASLVPLEGLVKLNTNSKMTNNNTDNLPEHQNQAVASGGITARPQHDVSTTADLIIQSLGINDREISEPGSDPSPPQASPRQKPSSPRVPNQANPDRLLDVPSNLRQPPVLINGSRDSYQNSIASSENMTCDSSEMDNNNITGDPKFPPPMDLLTIRTNQNPGTEKAWSDSCDSGVGHHENGFPENKNNQSVSPHSYYKMATKDTPTNAKSTSPMPPPNGLTNGPLALIRALRDPKNQSHSIPPLLSVRSKTEVGTHPSPPLHPQLEDEEYPISQHTSPIRRPALHRQSSSESSGCHEDDRESLSNITEMTESMEPPESIVGQPEDILSDLPPPPPSMAGSITSACGVDLSLDPPEPFSSLDTDQTVWGIQGAPNHSNLMETVLFCLSQSTLTQQISSPTATSQCRELNSYLKHHIMDPLQRRQLVRREVMVVFRRLLSDVTLGTMLKSGMIRDMQKIFRVLLEHVLALDPLYQLSNAQTGYTFMLMFTKDVRIGFPSVQQMLERACSQQQFKFNLVPSHLILLIPRTTAGQTRIFPNLQLNLTNVLEHARRACFMCGEVAVFECPECYQQEALDLSAAAFCETCSQTMHKHSKRERHLPIQLGSPLEIGDSDTLETNYTLDLTQVIGVTRDDEEERFSCLCHDSKSKTQDRENQQWLFYDSRHTEADGSVMPNVTPMTVISSWLTSAGYDRMSKEFDNLPIYIDRLLMDSCVCVYTKPLPQNYS